MFSQGNSFANGSTCNEGNSCSSDPRNTEPFFWHYQQGVQPGALI